MNWNHLTDAAQLEEIDRESAGHPVLIYKHSARCGICTAALGRIERKWPGTEAAPKPYMLDVLQHRQLSALVAGRYGVEHESPQALLIRDGKCVLHRSHMAVDPAEFV